MAGAWENDKLNGFAIIYYADGSINQEGIFKDDKFLYTQKRTANVSTLPACPSSGYFHNCYGTYFWTSGEFKGDKYVGDWKNDNRTGQGTYTYGPNSEWAGDKHVGEYKDNKRHGQGTYTFANGDKYVGEYKDNDYHGQGPIPMRMDLRKLVPLRMTN